MESWNSLSTAILWKEDFGDAHFSLLFPFLCPSFSPTRSLAPLKGIYIPKPATCLPEVIYDPFLTMRKLG